MKTWQQVLLGFLLGMLAAGIIWLTAASPRGTPIELAPPPTPAPLIVHISGAVKKPGVYSLPRESRVQDAVALAGGLLEQADAEIINLAARLSDGDKIHIPAQGEDLTRFMAANPALNSAESGTSAPINLNTATLNQLDALPGIGPAKAADILAYRQQNGPFQSIEDLLKVPGIGATILEGIRDQIFVANDNETP